MSNDKIERFQEILSSLHKDDEKITDIEQKQNYIQFCIEKLYDKLVDKIKDNNPDEEEEIDSLDEEQLQGLIIMEFIENEQDWFMELQEIITVDDIAEFVDEDQFEELKKQLEEESEESDDQQESSEEEDQDEETDETDPDSILEETGECVEPLQEDLLVDMSGGFQDNQQKKIKQMVLDENDLYDIQEMIIEIGEHLKDEIDQIIEEKEEEEEEEQDTDDDEDKDKEPDGTGPHGKGNGPGKGKADGSGLKKKKDDEEEDEDEKEEITEQQDEEIPGLRKDIASYIALSIKNGNSPDYALDDARDVFEGTDIGDIIQQYDVQKVWQDTKSLEELEQINIQNETTSE